MYTYIKFKQFNKINKKVMKISIKKNRKKLLIILYENHIREIMNFFCN